MVNDVTPFWVVDIEGLDEPHGPIPTLEEANKIAEKYKNFYGVEYQVFDNEVKRLIYNNDDVMFWSEDIL